ncbi:MAG: diguanylate cyclase (GGDEF)-like protein/PAS domain S-box-containing protein [Moritella dasanensis]|jgi:diguanylate cyclase (GGDEF)-like protein/PAS domain S-box-containing protein
MLKELKTSIVIQLIFVVSIVLSATTIYAIYNDEHQKERLAIENLSHIYVNLIESTINQALSATFPLAALVKKQQLDEDQFNQFATEMLAFYPNIAALQLAPNGVIRYIAPQAGNEKALGHNLLTAPNRNKESVATKNSGKLTLAGPFDLMQGGYGAAGRLPIYLDRPNGEEYFWGFATVLVHFPEVLAPVKLSALVDAGLAYQLSRTHPNTGEMQILASSPELLSDYTIVNSIKIANVTWMLKVSLSNGCTHYVSIFVMSLLGLLFTILATFSAISILRIRNDKTGLKNIVAARTKELDDNLKRLNLALTSAGQVWFELNVQSGDISFGGHSAKMAGYGPADVQTTLAHWLESIHPDDLGSASNKYQQSLRNGVAFELEYRRKGKDGQWLWIQTTCEFTAWDYQHKPTWCTGVHTDISQRKKIELHDNARSAVLEKLLKGDPLNIILEHIVSFIEQEQTGAQCSVLLANTRGNQLHCGFSSSSIPDFYNAAIDGIEIGDGVGSCGTAAFTKQRVIVENTQTHPYWSPFKALAAKAQLASCWSEPIIGSNNQLLGTFAIYHHQPSTPTARDFKLLEFAVQLSVIAIERNLSDEKIKLSSRVFSETNEGLMITDVTGRIIDINPAFTRATGYSLNEVLGQTPSILSSNKQSPIFFIEMWQSLVEQGYWHGEVWNKKKNGELFAARLSISSLSNDDGETLHYVGLFADITQAKQQQKKLELMAHYDMLTELPNRSLLADRFKLGISHSQQTGTMLGVCFLDLDNFKPVNDRYGHDIGDQLLIAVAQRLNANIRNEDTASRQGGDEFVLLLGEIESLQHCQELLTRINDCLAQPYLIAGHIFNISVSIGVTLYPDNDADLDTLLRHADYSMYQAKLAGKNRFHLFNPEQDKQKTQKNQQLDEIKQALLNNEFALYYQPKINMKTGEVYGAEALIRWLHPEDGLIPPLDFLPIIEGSALEIQIGDWVINQALKQTVEWQQQGIFLEVSVNIACYHLISPAFLTQLENALASYPHFNAKYLQLEILESGALTDLNTIRDILNTCLDVLGVNIALDDFGTGYSSLTHLKDLPANTIKIDQSFVKNMLDDPDDYAIINGVLALAGSFNRAVIAEGVETTEHGLMLLEMGCYAAQGYGIARPMPAAKIPRWIRNYIPNQQWLDSGNTVRTAKQG